MTLNVLLADDEYIVLKGLEIILKEQTEVNLKLVTSMDAEDALRKLDTFRPDVVIADINMPEIDGFEMIGMIQQKCPGCRFIICSGYDEYEYLKKALHYHVADYLLKPVDKTALIQRLSAIVQEKEKAVSHTLLRIQLLLFKGQSGSEADFSEAELEHIFPDNSFCLCAANLSDCIPDEVVRILTQYFDTVYTLTLNSRIIFLINYSDRIQTREVRSILEHIFSRQIWGCTFFSSESEKAAAIRAISLRYQEALSEMVLTLLPESEQHRSCIRERTLFPAIRVITFEDNIEDYIQNLLRNIPIEFCCSIAFTEIITAYILVSDIILPVDLIRQLYPADPDTLCTKKALTNFVKKILNFWYDSFSKIEHANCSSKIASACRYIELHYQEDISLDQIAEILDVNASYLSYIFKKETGSTLIQYLTNVRIEQACHLLHSQPELSLDEVALRAGYHSTTYFHKIFRARFGVSPRQWQLSHLDK